MTELEKLLREEDAGEASGLRDAWATAGSVRAPGQELLESESLAMRRNLLAAADHRSPSGRVLRLPGRLVAAAAVVVLIGVGWWGLVPRSIQAPAGLPHVVELSDGTRVTLRAGSRLRVPGGLLSFRALRLSGEAHFAVVPGPAFRVATGRAHVLVLGTRFTVRSWPSESSDRIFLEEGSIRVTGLLTGDSLLLDPGQAASVGPDDMVFGGWQAPEALDWQAGDFVFVDRPLGEVLADVSRRFGMPVTLSAGDLTARRVNGAFRVPRNAESVVADLALSLGLAYRETSVGFELFRP